MAKDGQGKKKGGKAAASLSPEEQEIVKQRQAHVLRARLQDLMEQERLLTRSVMCDIEARWITFLRDARFKELVRQIELQKRDFERLVDRKKSATDMLLAGLEVAEEQQRTAVRSHEERIDALLEFHRRRTAELEEEFEKRLQRLQRESEGERAEIERRHAIELSDLQLILTNMAANADRLDRRLQEELSEAHEASMEKMEEDKRQLLSGVQRTNAALRAELDARYKEFMSHAQANVKEYMEKSKDDHDTAERIAAQLRKIDKLQDNIATWKSNLANNSKEWEQRNAALRAEKDAITQQLVELKRRMSRWRGTEADRLRVLVSNSRKTEDALQGISKKTEGLLRLVELCRALETERERTVPATLTDADDATRDGTKESDSILAGADLDWRAMESFLLRHNQVVLDNTALDQERAQLLSENETLKNLLKQYLDGVSVNDTVMKNKNCLLLTNRKPVTAVQAAAMAGGGSVRQTEYVYNTPNTVVDGNRYVADVSRQQTGRR